MAAAKKGKVTAAKSKAPARSAKKSAVSRAKSKPKAKASKKESPAMSKIKSLKDAVQQAIDQGATTVQEIYQKIAAMPFDQLEKIAAIEGLVKKARGLHDQSVGTVYDTIRAVNARVGELADNALKKLG